MPKVSSRTFTGCWTCRKRNIRCNDERPTCGPCIRSSRICEGYDVRLVWVDPLTGNYTPEQRRAFPVDLTWRGRPTLTLREVDHLIAHTHADADDNEDCSCRIDEGFNPFGAFPSRSREVTDASANGNVDNGARRKTGVQDEQDADDAGQQEDSVVEEQPCRPDVRGLDSVTPLSRRKTSASSSLPINANHIGSIILYRSTQHEHMSLPLIPHLSHRQQMLFHHYETVIAPLNARSIADGDFKLILSRLAVSDAASTSGSALLHAILAKSAHHLSTLASDRYANEHYRKAALTQFGNALHSLQKILPDPSREGYSTTLAAMLSITLAQHAIHGQTNKLGHHINGIARYINQRIRSKPWRASEEACIVTRCFFLHILSWSGTATTAALKSRTVELINVQNQVIKDADPDSSFGNSIGSTPRLMKCFHDVFVLRERMMARGVAGMANIAIASLPDDEKQQVERIFAELALPLDADIDIFMSRQPPGSSSSRQRTFVGSQLQLFRSALSIYFLAGALRYPPHVLASRVLETLTLAVELLESDNTAVAIWPVFSISARAYTRETQALANRAWQLLISTGIGSRQAIHDFVKGIWQRREDVAAELGRDVGDVDKDWSEMMQTQELEFLLL